MIGTVVNIALVLAGGSAGLLVKALPKRFESILMQSIGLFTLGLGSVMALKLARPVSLVMGFLLSSLLGEALKLQDVLNSFGEKLKNTLGGGERFTEGM